MVTMSRSEAKKRGGRFASAESSIRSVEQCVEMINSDKRDGTSKGMVFLIKLISVAFTEGIHASSRYMEKQKKEDQIKKYYRAKEVSDLLGIGLSTVWMYSKQGRLTPKKLSEKVTVFDIEEVRQLLNELEDGA